MKLYPILEWCESLEAEIEQARREEQLYRRELEARARERQEALDCD